MTVSTSIASKTYDGGVATDFPTEFVFFTPADIEVIERIKATGEETTKTLTTDYTVTGGNGSDGTVTAVSLPPNTVTWTIRRVVTETQETALPVSGSLPAGVLERMVDRVVMLIQQHSEEIARSLLLPVTSSLTGLTIPDPTANNLLGWNAGATNLENKVITDASTTVITAFAATLLDDANAATARTTLEAAALDAKGADIASASALTLGTDGNYFDVTGTTAITSINTVAVGTAVRLHFDDALTLTHNATDLILPGGANITTAAGDEFTFVEYAAGDWRCVSYTLANGKAVVESVSSQTVLQTVYTEITTTSTGTNTVPVDNTLPQAGEMNEVGTLAITPLSASSNLFIECNTYASEVTNTGAVVFAAVFETAVSNDAIVFEMNHGAANSIFGSGIEGVQLKPSREIASTGTAARTFSLRVALNVGTVGWNRVAGGTTFGGSLRSFIKITEYA